MTLIKEFDPVRLRSVRMELAAIYSLDSERSCAKI